MKKLISSVLILLVLAASFAATVSADTEALYFAGIDVNMPEINAEVKGLDYDIADVSANLGTVSLNPVSIENYDPAIHSSRVFMLVDTSSSLEYDTYLIQDCITSYADTLGADDALVVITFGGPKAEMILDGSENMDEVYSVIDSIYCDQSGTCFYEALGMAYDEANATSSGDFDRNYVIAFSDGVDEQDGGKTFDETIKDYASHSLPLYAACFSSYDTASIDKFGEIARSSGGSLSMIYEGYDFENLLYEINNVSLLKLEADNNIADGNKKLLSVKIGDKYIEQEVLVSRHIPDTAAPAVEEFDFDSDNKTLFIKFSEKLSDSASDPASYTVTNSDGKAFDIKNVKYSSTEFTVTLTFTDIINGDYTVTFNNITDYSQEQNPISESVAFTAEGIVVPTGDRGGNSMSLWVIIIIICVLIAAGVGVVLIIVITSKKRSDDQYRINENIPVNNDQNQLNYVQAPPVVKHHVVVNASKKVRLHIRTGNISEQSVETQVQSSLIIGRSNTCDIFIDDTKLSRQHFAIEYDNDNFYIMDLQSRNGTILNGYKVIGRQLLKSGDRITAGLSDIHFTVVR